MFTTDQTLGSSAAYRTGCTMLFIATAVIVAALGFEHIGGYMPCPLCLQQRYAYYAAIPLLFAALVLVTAEQPRWAAALFALVALAFLANAGLGTYHAGAEWKFWPGPKDCSGTLGAPASVDDLFKGMATETGVRCDEPQFRFAGLSFAGWNVIASILLAAGTIKAAFQVASRA